MAPARRGRRQLKQIGSSGQISLGKEYAGRTAEVELVEPGLFVIRLGRFIADAEARPEAATREPS
jgi:hypothetical protein